MTNNSTPKAKNGRIKAAVLAVVILGSSLVGFATTAPASAMMNDGSFQALCEMSGGTYGTVDSDAGWHWDTCSYADGTYVVE